MIRTLGTGRLAMPLVVVLITVLGCKGGEKAAPAEPAKGDKAGGIDKPGDKPTDKKRADRPKRASSIEEAKAKALFDKWLAAQNGGDFDAYMATYASKFEGIKRVGDKKTSYDRAGWAKDRGRMFKRTMKVTAESIVIKTDPNMASVRFVQTWASGTFQDVGPKRLEMVMEGDDLRIAKEEMLESHTTPALAKYAKTMPSELLKGDKLPAPVQIELAKIASDGDGLKYQILWVQKLTRELIVYEAAGESDVDQEDDYSAFARGGPGLLVVLKRKGAHYVLEDVGGGNGYNFEAIGSRDIDGDGVNDLVFSWRWTGDHEDGSGIAIVLTASAHADIFEVSEGWGEGGEGEGTSIEDMCTTKIDGQVVLMMALLNSKTELGPSDDPTADDVVTTERAFMRFFRLDNGTFASQELFGYVIDHGKDGSALTGNDMKAEAWSGHYQGGTNEELLECPAPAAKLGLIVEPNSVPGAKKKDGMYMLSGFSLTKAAAKKKAATAGVGADKVFKIATE